jgi:hypothetical protein
MTLIGIPLPQPLETIQIGLQVGILQLVSNYRSVQIKTILANTNFFWENG